MKKLITLLLVAFAATTAYAADDCAATAAEKEVGRCRKEQLHEKMYP